MLSTKSSSVTFFIFKGEHEFHGFHECFPILLIAVKKNTNTIRMVYARDSPLIKKC